MLSIYKVVVTPFQQNCRILWDSAGSEAAVVDPGGDVDLIIRTLDELNLKCTEIWLTHSHLDHCGGVSVLKEKTEAKLFGHVLGKKYRENILEVCRMYGMPPGDMKNCPEPDELIDDKSILKIGSEELTALFTPGHSPDHLCFYHSESSQLIAGDTVFSGSIGRTDLPGGDLNVFMRSIKEIILVLPDDTKLLSGHGPDTTLGVEKLSNPFLVEGANG